MCNLPSLAHRIVINSNALVAKNSLSAPNCFGAAKWDAAENRPIGVGVAEAERTSSGHLRSCSFSWTPADTVAASLTANRTSRCCRTAVCPLASVATGWWRSWATAAGTTAGLCAVRLLRCSTVLGHPHPLWTYCENQEHKVIFSSN